MNDENYDGSRISPGIPGHISYEQCPHPEACLTAVWWTWLGDNIILNMQIQGAPNWWYNEKRLLAFSSGAIARFIYIIHLIIDKRFLHGQKVQSVIKLSVDVTVLG